MPTIATMNGIHRSAAASAPLDLRTRERAGSRSLAGPDTPRRTGEGEPGNGATSPAEQRGRRPPVPPPAPTSSHPPTPDKSRRVAPAPGGSCPSRLPFRKRPFPSGAETSHRDTHVAAESASLAHRQSPPKRLKEEADAGDRLCEAPSRCIGALEESGDVYSVGPVHHFNPYPTSPSGHHHHHPVYPFYCISLAPITKRPLPAPLTFQTEPQMANADVAMATHQDEDGDTPLHIAVVQGKEDLVHMLIYILVLACRDLNIYNNLRQTPLHLAVIMQNAAMVDALLRAGADAATLDRNGQTALHLCCEYNHPDCLSILLLHSSTCLEIRNYEGLSPLHVAVQGGHRDLARMLLEAGADINAMDIKSGQSPLMHAVENNNVDMVHFLIESGSDVNTHSYSGNTALHSACGRGQVDTVRLLMKNGADCSLKNYHNDTPVMVAKNKMITDVLRGKRSKLASSQDQHVVLSSSHSNDAT